MDQATAVLSAVLLLYAGGEPVASRAARQPTGIASYKGLDPDRFMRQWLVCGPFPVREPDGKPLDEAAHRAAFTHDLLTEHGGETGIQPAPGLTHHLEETEYAWRSFTGDQDVIDIDAIYGRRTLAITYATAEIEMSAPRTLLLGIGSSDPVRIWLNGELLHDYWGGGGVILDEHLVLAPFRAGRNRLLLKVIDAVRPRGFVCRRLGLGAVSARRLLLRAATDGQEKVAQYLLSHGARADARDADGWTPLHHAAYDGRQALVELLLAKGADIDARSVDNVTPLHLARRSGFRQLAAFLAAHGADAKIRPARADVSGAGMDPERLAKIPARLKEFVDQGTLVGAVTLVARHGVVASLEAVGYQDMETKKRMRTNTVFQIQSMTKSFTAVGIMILLEEGRLLLSDPVEKHLPEFREQLVIDSRDGDKVLTTRKPSRPITIRDLLTHTSGIMGDADSEIQRVMRRGTLAERMALANTLRSMTLAERVQRLSQEPLEFEPGTQYLYSSRGYQALGRIIEVVSGQAYEKFMEQRVFRPLGMKDTSYVEPPDRAGRLASIYAFENGQLKKQPREPRQGTKYVSPSGGWRSTASDLFAFYQMMLNGGTYRGARILSRASAEAMTAVQTGDLPALSPGAGYGFGWEVVRGPHRLWSLYSIGSYSHGGAWRTLALVDPKKDLVVLFLTQLAAPSRQVPARSAFFNMAAAAIVD